MGYCYDSGDDNVIGMVTVMVRKWLELVTFIICQIWDANKWRNSADIGGRVFFHILILDEKNIAVITMLPPRFHVLKKVQSLMG